MPQNSMQGLNNLTSPASQFTPRLLPEYFSVLFIWYFFQLSGFQAFKQAILYPKLWLIPLCLGEISACTFILECRFMIESFL